MNYEEFLEENRSLIENSDFVKIYLDYSKTRFWTNLLVGLEKLGINPLIDFSLDTLPPNFFAYAGITKITIPGAIRKVYPYAFWECEDLQEVVIEEGLESIDEEVFYACKKLKKLNLPHSLEYLGGGVFNGCDSLSFVNYNGTAEEWNKIKKDDQWNTGFNGIIRLLNN